MEHLNVFKQLKYWFLYKCTDVSIFSKGEAPILNVLDIEKEVPVLVLKYKSNCK